MSPDTQKPISKRGSFSDGSNLVVLLSILLVSVSIALGLNIHLGMDIPLASIVGFSLFVGLVGFQVWQKTSSENQALKEEIDYLEAEVERIRVPSSGGRLDAENYKPVKIPIQTSFLDEKPSPPSGASISIVKENDVDAIQQRIKDMLSQVSSTEQSQVQPEEFSQEVTSQVSIEKEENKTQVPTNPEKSLDVLRNAMQSLRPKSKEQSPEALSEAEPSLASAPLSLSEDSDTSPEIIRSSETRSSETLSAAPQVPDLISVQQALKEGRVEVFLEPILSLGEHAAKHYEVSIRLRSASDEDLGTFETENMRGYGLIPLIDAACFQRSALIAERLANQGREGSVFTRSSGETLLDSNFNQMLEKDYTGRQSVFRQMVLCLTQSDIRSFRAEEQRAVGKLSSLGLRFAVLGVSDLDMNFEAMARAGFNFARLETGVLKDGLSCPNGKIPAPEIAGYLAKHDFTLIVNGIDSEETLARIYEFGVLFGQGSLFGGRRPVKADLVPRTSQVAA